jgi:hypothetical protein
LRPFLKDEENADSMRLLLRPLTFGFVVALGALSPVVPQSVAGATTGLTFNPTNLRFGEVVLGSAETLAVRMTNNGSSNVIVSTMAVNGAYFTVSGLRLPLTLDPGQGVRFTVSFNPTALGPVAGTVVFNGNAASLNLHGLGVSSALISNPPSLEFGNVPAGGRGSLFLTLTNYSENTSITLSKELTLGSGFTVSGLTLPLTLEAGHSVTFSIMFSPLSTGPANSTFQALNSNGNTIVGVPLTGAGVPSVSLSWNPSTSGVTGYNVYRGTVSGGPYSKLNSSMDPGTRFVDTSVVPGDTYYYVTTAVNSSGQESGYSNEVKVVIP